MTMWPIASLILCVHLDPDLPPLSHKEELPPAMVSRATHALAKAEWRRIYEMSRLDPGRSEFYFNLNSEATHCMDVWEAIVLVHNSDREEYAQIRLGLLRRIMGRDRYFQRDWPLPFGLR